MSQPIPPEIQASAKRMLERHRAMQMKAIHGKPKWQQDLADTMRKVDALRYKYVTDPHLREIEQKLLAKAPILSDLVCPACGEGNKGNRMNGKPWCMKCNVPLIPKRKLEAWLKLPEIKVSHSSLKDEIERLRGGR